jgi:hypothetical protein
MRDKRQAARSTSAPMVGSPKSVVLLVSLAIALAGSSGAQAQVVMSGQWRSGATAIDVQVESWGTDCGPQPTSSQSSGGGLVRIVQLGEQLQLHSGSRVIKSDVCFGQNPNLKRKSKTVKDNTWVTRCETPTDDPRAETGVYTLKLLSPDRLLYQDVSRFRWQLKTSLCVATITTVQTLTRLTDAEAAQASKPKAEPAPPATTPPPPTPPSSIKTTKADAAPPPAPSTAAPAPPKLPDLPSTVASTAATGKPPPPAKAPPPSKASKPPCVPGPATRLALAPRRRTIELGSRFCFRTRVVDAAGCALPAITPTWKLDAGPALRAQLDARGCFEASTQAADGEGSFHVTATVTTPTGDTLRAEAKIAVVTADLSALVAKRLFEEDAEGSELEAELEAQTEATAPAAEAVAATSHTATRAVGAAEAPVTRPPWMWPAIGFVLAALGGAIALVARRRTRASLVPEQTALPTRDAPAPPAPTAPLAAVNKVLPHEAGSAGELKCPKCGAIYPAGSAFCGTDGTPLKP